MVGAVTLYAAMGAVLADGSPVAIARDTPPDATPPRGWHLAAAGRAMLTQPDLTVEWA